MSRITLDAKRLTHDARFEKPNWNLKLIVT